jgi:hypothetical protein
LLDDLVHRVGGCDSADGYDDQVVFGDAHHLAEETLAAAVVGLVQTPVEA